MVKFLREAFLWAYPPHCMSCRNAIDLRDKRRVRRYLCESCEPLFVPMEPPYCPKCGGPSKTGACRSCGSAETSVEKNFALYEYDALMREIIHRMKYRSMEYIAKGLAQLAADCAVGDGEAARFFYEGGFSRLVPVPMTEKKLRRRGFNPSLILARAIGEKICVPVDDSALVRLSETVPQNLLEPFDRAKNLGEVFAAARGHEADG
ncbi:MAG: double zinc ribbon domain-containing protein, partial [Defluviitaleaceae bacterium]|nr:double zinc ribbon domain-containing protein [Defluviitaleaceae bacterium]